MIQKIVLTVGGLALIVAVIAIAFFGMMHKMAAAGAAQVFPPIAVTTLPASQESWSQELSSVGTLTAVQGVTVSAQLDGPVVAISFQPGAEVKAGAVLVQQDVSSEQAQLRSLEAAASLANINLRRSMQLRARNTIAQSQLDTDRATYEVAVGQVDNVRTEIEKKTIRAPFAGRLGVRQVNLGQNLKAGDPIVSLQSLGSVYADFYLPEQDLSQVATGQEVRVTSDAYPGIPETGRITTLDPGLDMATRNIHLQATLDNGDEHLRPGMFVKVDVVLPKQDQVIVVPLTAVIFAPYGDSVFVVDSQTDPKTGVVRQTARQQLVRLGEKRGDFVAVASGLKVGEIVVTSGGFKLHGGFPVTANNALAPAAELAPRPNDS